MRKLKQAITVIVILVLVFNLSSSFGKSGISHIEGKVIDNMNNEPIIYAVVAIGSTKDSSIVKTAYTDSSGYYQINGINDGQYYILAQMVGYNKFTEPIIIDSIHKNTEKIIKLDVYTQKEVKVVAKRPFIEAKSDRLILNTDAQIAAAGETVFETLKKAPGVYIDKDDNIQLRGKNGVLILINDKPTYLLGSQLANYLKGIQSNEVEKIEIITNPPAKYDASGNSGIINIKLKKNTKMGLNGSVNNSVWHGEHSSGNMGGNLNLRSGKVNLYTNIYPGDYNGYNTMDMNRYITYENSTTKFSELSKNEWEYKSLGYTVGADYDIDKRQTIGLMARGGRNSSNDSRISSNYIYSLSTVADSNLLANGMNNNSYNNQSVNLNYHIAIDTTGKELSVDLDYAGYNNNGNSSLNTSYFDPNNIEMRSPSLIKGSTPVDVNIQSVKADYIYPYKGYRFETGAKASMVNTDNQIQYSYYDNNSWINDDRRTNHFKYSEGIMAGYAVISKEFGKTSVKTGFRVENTFSDGNSLTLNERVKRQYIDFFPSFFIQQKLNDKNNIGFNYNRRIDRPNYESLNPFIYFLDEYTMEKGNPFLQPQYTNSFTLNHGYANAIFTALSYNRTSNPQIQLIRQNDTTKIGYETYENIDLMENYNFNVGLNMPVVKWYRVSANFNTFINKYESKKGTDNLNNNSLSMNIWSGHYFTLPKNYVFEISSWYQAPHTYGIYKLSSQLNIDLGLQKQLFNGKSTLKIFVRDVLKTNHVDVKVNYANVNLTNTNNWESRSYGFSFTYRFGSNDIKPAREHHSGLEEEQNRVKTGK